MSDTETMEVIWRIRWQIVGTQMAEYKKAKSQGERDEWKQRMLEKLVQMNEIAQKYYDTSRPAYCARHGFVDEIVELSRLRVYLKAFAGAAYQNPASICPRHQMLLPRLIKG